MIQMTNGDWVNPGCHVEGWWGQYAADRVVVLAHQCGWDSGDRRAVQYCVGRIEYVASQDSSWEAEFPDGYELVYADQVDCLEQAATDYLNSLLPTNPDGTQSHLWGWHEGEYYLLTIEEWEEM